MAKGSWFKNLIHPLDDDEEEDYRGYTPPAPEPPVKPRPTSASPAASTFSSINDASPGQNNIQVKSIHSTVQLQIASAKPEKFDSVIASRIADHLRERRTVILNLENTDKDNSRRLLDFLSGVAYALEGRAEQIGIHTYVLTPYNVDLLDDIVEELENNGLYF